MAIALVVALIISGGELKTEIPGGLKFELKINALGDGIKRLKEAFGRK